MAVVTWQIAGKVFCRRAEPVELLEEHIYPIDFLDDATAPFQLRARMCRWELECREAGLPCRWTGLNPNYDPFAA